MGFFQKVEDFFLSTRTREILGRVLIGLAVFGVVVLFAVIVGRGRVPDTDDHDLAGIPDIPVYVLEETCGPQDSVWLDSVMLSGTASGKWESFPSSDGLSGVRKGFYGRFVESVLSEEEAWRGWLHFLMYAFPLLLLVWMIVRLIGRPARPKTVYETRTVVQKCELPPDVLRRGDVRERCLEVSEEELAGKYGCIYCGWMGDFFWEWLYNRIKKAEDIPSGAVRFVMDAFKGGNILTLKDYDSYVDYVNRTEFFKYHDIDSFRDFVFRKEDEERGMHLVRRPQVGDCLFDEKKECAASGGSEFHFGKPGDLPESLDQFLPLKSADGSCGTAEPEEEDEPCALEYREMPVSEVNDSEKECPDPDLPEGVDIDGLRSEELDSKDGLSDNPDNVPERGYAGGPVDLGSVAREEVYRKVYDRFRYTYGLTDEEMRAWQSGEKAPEMFRPMEMGSYPTDVEVDVRYFSKHTNIGTALVEEILLFSLKNPYMEFPSDVWKQARIFSTAIRARVEMFQESFNPLKDERDGFFRQFFHELLQGLALTDRQIDMLIGQIPYRLPGNIDQRFCLTFDESREKYFREFGKPELAEDEQEAPKGNLPLDIDRLRRLFLRTKWGWKPVCPEDRVEEFVAAIGLIEQNRRKREEAGLSNGRNHIPSGARARESKIDDVALLKANLLLMQNEDKEVRVLDMLYRYKYRRTFVRRLVMDLKMSQQRAEELASFKGEE